MPKRVVLDTNIFIASLFGKTSGRIVDLWESGELILVVSRAMLAEYSFIANRFRFRRKVESVLSRLDSGHNTVLVEPGPFPNIIKDDPDDDKFLACAVAGNAEAIVTSDRHLLLLGRYEGIPILKPAEFMRELNYLFGWDEMEETPPPPSPNPGKE